MNRSSSMSSNEDCRQRPAVPPWERHNFVQVPFMDASSPQLSDEEKHALPSLWAAQTNEASGRRAQLDTTRNCASSGFTYPSSSEDTMDHWSRPVPNTTLPLQAPPLPYETPLIIPPGARKSPPPNPHTAQNAPPTPPESLSNSSTFSSAGSPTTGPPVTALPGTMTSRAWQGSRSRARSTGRTQNGHRHHRSEPTGLGKRVKSAFREMFKRDPVDESSLEKISDRHWTEEY